MEPDIDPTLEAARDQVVDAYLDAPGINGVGIGTKTVGGRHTDVTAVRVYVTRKRPSQLLPTGAELPKSVRVRGTTVPIDVVQAGPFHALQLLSRADETRSLRTAGTDSYYADRYRPVPFGASIGHRDVTAGTTGCLVVDARDGSQVVLSNNHVLANVNKAQVGDPIVQPGVADGGRVGPDTVAHLKRFVRINPDPARNVVDAAIATPTATGLFVNQSPEQIIAPVSAQHRAVGLLFAGDCSGMILGCLAAAVMALLEVRFPGGVVAPRRHMLVEKVGRTTGWTVSSISDIGMTVPINLGDGFSTHFYNLFMMERFGHAGDSGSIILEAGA